MMTIYPDFFIPGNWEFPGTAKIFPGIPENQKMLIFAIDTVAFFQLPEI